jgi:hypothetical protein
MSAQRWKRQERAIATALGVRRIPNSGAGQPDIRAAGWAIQVKTRQQLPAWLWDAIDQAQRDAGEGERPAVVLADVSQGRKARRLVVLDFDAWASTIGACEP